MEPRVPRETIEILTMIPQRIDPVQSIRMGEKGWGLHAVQGCSLYKILVWITVVTVLGLLFVLFLLLFRDKTDLVGVFVPATFLSTMLLMFLSIPQIVGVA